MKTIIFLILFTFFSCKPDYVKNPARLEGTWALESFEYVNELGEDMVIRNPNTRITFETKPNKQGTQSFDNKNYNFLYNIGSEQCTISFPTDDIKNLSLTAIGRVQVYNFNFFGNNDKIEFFTEREYDYTTKKVLMNVRYVFNKVY